jgi:glycosyltransferase involved in cell wall biosynthesis
MVNIYARKADIILTVSECSKKDILNYCKISQEKVKVIYNMITDEFKPDNNTNYKKYGLQENYVLYVGNLCPHKNLDTLINAYSLLKDDIRTKNHLVIIAKIKGVIGKVDQRMRHLELMELSKELKISENVHFVDLKDNNDLANLYTSAGVLVVPSYYEGFGFPIVEAFACGCPVIAANTSSIPEVVNNSAILFDPDNHKELSDKIEMVLKDNVKREELKIKGFKRAGDFRHNRIKDIVLNALNIKNE